MFVGFVVDRWLNRGSCHLAPAEARPEQQLGALWAWLCVWHRPQVMPPTVAQTTTIMFTVYASHCVTYHHSNVHSLCPTVTHITTIMLAVYAPTCGTYHKKITQPMPPTVAQSACCFTGPSMHTYS